MKSSSAATRSPGLDALPSTQRRPHFRPDQHRLDVGAAHLLAALEQFLLTEAMRLEHTAALISRAREFLIEGRVLFPADSALTRIVGEQRKSVREHIVTRLAQNLPAAVNGVRLSLEPNVR